MSRSGSNVEFHPVRVLIALFVAPMLVGMLAVPSGAARSADAPAVTLSGAGSTFDQPFFARAFYQYSETNPSVTINYAAIGSSGGVQQLQAQTVNFGATDVPMDSTDQAAATGGPVLQVPVDLGGVTVSYNLAGVPTGLRLTGPLLAEIFLGEVTDWNSKLIAALNPGVRLPDEPITVVHRSDGSGTTYIFTNYLATISPTWLNQLGVAKTINWPVGVGGQGNQGVATLIQDIPGTIGYVELAYALQAHFAFCRIRNAAGKFVSPNVRSVAADAAQKAHVTPVNFSIVDEPGVASYPIAGYSWIAIYQRQGNLATAETLDSMLSWLTHAGQKYAADLDYVSLPANIERLAAQTLVKMVGPNGQPIPKS